MNHCAVMLENVLLFLLLRDTAVLLLAIDEPTGATIFKRKSTKNQKELQGSEEQQFCSC